MLGGIYNPDVIKQNVQDYPLLLGGIYNPDVIKQNVRDYKSLTTFDGVNRPASQRKEN